MKKFVRAVGIDDAPFKFNQKKTNIFFTVMRAPNYIEGFMRTEVEVDGKDATEKILNCLTTSRFFEQLDVIFIDGSNVAGFNVVDIEKVFTVTKIPVITITREEPDREAIEKTLRAKFVDWEERLAILQKIKLRQMKGVKKPIYVGIVGLEPGDAEILIRRFTVLGSLPEPLRISHMLGSLLEFGESKRGR
ncbi:MAG: DUF99 family protein [Thermoplasmata archaeon]